MDYIAKPLHKNPYPMDHEIYNFGRPAFGHHYYVHSTSMSDPYLGVEKRNFKEIMHFHSMTNTTIPQLVQETLPKGHEIYNFCIFFLGNHYYILSKSDLCHGVEKKIFKELMHFHNITYMDTPQHKNPCPYNQFV